MRQSHLELEFGLVWVDEYPHIDLHAEYPFALPERKFRFDFAHLPSQIAIEIQGGNYGGGRHVRPKSLEAEYEKLNIAADRGWRVFFLHSGNVGDRAELARIAQAIRRSDAGDRLQ